MVARICANCGYRRVLYYDADNVPVSERPNMLQTSRFVWCLKKSLPVSARSLCGMYDLYSCETF